MIKHIVLWKIEGKDRHKKTEELKIKLLDLKASISSIEHLEVGLTFNQTQFTSDVCLYSEFRKWHDLNDYREHPKHLEVLEFIKDIVKETRVIDYEV
tara:strand:- start:167 stop:457 length:291 start_codon:yes stop_codon:yes gene_type:complete